MPIQTIQKENKILRSLVNAKRLTQEQYKSLMDEAAGLRIEPDILLETKKLIPEEDIAQAKSLVYNVALTELYGLSVDRKILEIIPRETAEHYQVVPFAIEKNILKVAILNPGDFKAIEAVNFICRQKKLKPQFYTSPASALKNVLAQYTGLEMEVEQAVGAAESRFAPIGSAAKVAIGLEEISKGAPISKLVGSILKYAVDNSASDIHIEPLADKTRIRYRLDGILRETAMLPGHLHSSIISRIKVMSDLKLDETRIPQDGRIRVKVSKRQVDMRVSIFPLLDKEKAVLRILDPAKRVFSLKDLGFWGIGLEVIKRNLEKPHGMILITGPTGCGKSTSLYAVMKGLNSIKVNIITLEDPIEYFIPGLNQSQVMPDIGYTFASGLRSIVRQDPDIIMVGEIRDNETADLATHSALTGHIVLSTLHTNDAFGAIPRLKDMGIEPFLIASSLNLVVAQRLVRKICIHCKIEIEFPPDTEKKIEGALKFIDTVNLDEFRSKNGRLRFYKGKGCPRCGKEGYKGRTAIFEALEVNERMEQIIMSGSNVEKVKQEFNRQKMIEMINDGYIKALRGEITLEEAMRAAME